MQMGGEGDEVGLRGFYWTVGRKFGAFVVEKWRGGGGWVWALGRWRCFSFEMLFVLLG